ncbi:MAG: permease prefix domain 1-containing protein [Acidobacteriota bacterium]|nr:permease prefix domain 1-containing protein [Acidobacteriota bacterium]
MISKKRFLAKLRNFLSPNRAEHESAREVASHLALLEDDFVNRGMTPEEARLAAKRAYGGIEQVKQMQREERSFLWLEQVRQDLRFCAHMLGKQPVFTLAAVISLGLGLGVNTAVFTLLNALVLRPLPIPNPQELVRIGSLGNNRMTMPLPGPMLVDLRKEPALGGVCGFTAGDAIVEIDGNSSALASRCFCRRTIERTSC